MLSDRSFAKIASIMPRRSAEEARGTKSAIVARALDVASVDGLEGLTIGRLADDLGMSKAGVIGHFGSKQLLQLAAVEAAAETFARRVGGASKDVRPGVRRLLAFCDAWVDHMVYPDFPGGCFYSAVGPEFDGRSGPVRDAIADLGEQMDLLLRREIELAIEAGEMPPEPGPVQLAFELRALFPGLNMEVQLLRRDNARDLGRRAVRRILGLPAGATPKKLGG